MRFIESRLLGIQIDEAGREVVLSFIDSQGRRFAVQLHGVERLLVSEMRQQNVVEAVTQWKRGGSPVGLREAAFSLMTGVDEKDCAPELAMVAREVADRVVRGDLELMEVNAIFGAQVLASFASMQTIWC
ncbi:MAG TPA: hypothetical protein VHA82_00815 [Ramlibacter sp.]|uniref:hypothetical protein n=1 Tax=Ramlibacter sp. TaxID=1917967 RepID=UPI002C155F0D|nr:hypothetical protein [Ramlibacter sp.]HVZ42321.1 hypothetical protein [Ramlibacter sp.]